MGDGKKRNEKGKKEDWKEDCQEGRLPGRKTALLD
jgi:hypothetical protein